MVISPSNGVVNGTAGTSAVAVAEGVDEAAAVVGGVALAVGPGDAGIDVGAAGHEEASELVAADADEATALGVTFSPFGTFCPQADAASKINTAAAIYLIYSLICHPSFPLCM
jgi:hypothetical protein